MNTAVKNLALKLRMLYLTARRKQVRSGQIATSYNRRAAAPDALWLAQLQPLTDRLVEHLPAEVPEGILMDLGCGAGYGTGIISKRYPQHTVLALDISSGMLEQARKRLANRRNLAWINADMLAFLEHRPGGGDALILSTWAIGYSHPTQIIRHAGRLLKPGGVLAFLVNYADTLGPVTGAIRACMVKFPGQVRRAVSPNLPDRWEALDEALHDAGLTVAFHEDGNQAVRLPPEVESRFDWCLDSGLLTGFDAALPLDDRTNPATAFLRAEIDSRQDPLLHHYTAVVAIKS